ncbi:MAG: PQQ-dependent sugar dehydrogenase [Actinobacteria bacterium]|nr:PQQ-dependent sugar dehydrogenase [Actinomycetota bacterium]
MTERARQFGVAVLLGAALLALWACAGGANERAAGGAAPTGASSGTPDAAAAGGEQAGTAATRYSVRRYVSGTPQAVGMAFDDKGRLLYAEKDNGRIMRFSNGRKTVLAKLNVSAGGEAGLLGLAGDSSGGVYAYYTGPSESCPNPTTSSNSSGVAGHCVWRFKPTGNGRLTADHRVFSADHPSSAENHVGGGLHFGPDGALYLSLGDLGENDDPDKGPGRAQSLSVPFGKILRLNPAGDNDPASGNPDQCGNADNTSKRNISDKRIWACGLRNTYQFAFDGDGQMWGSEAGDGCDEINRVSAGVNYGWQPPRTDCSGSGEGRPVLKVTGTPSGITVPTSTAARGWRNDVFYCIFNGNVLMRYDRSTRKTSQVRKADGHCSYDLISRGGRLYMSAGDDIYRLSIRR